MVYDTGYSSDKHYCRVLDILQISENDFKVTCNECGKVRYWNAFTGKFYNKIYPQGPDAEFHPVTIAEMK
jgi:hypothetical protein